MLIHLSLATRWRRLRLEQSGSLELSYPTIESRLARVTAQGA
jgi:hypothetical protein